MTLKNKIAALTFAFFVINLNFCCYASGINNLSAMDEEVFDKLYAFNIIEEDFKDKEFLTRGDMVKYTVRMLGDRSFLQGEKTPFTDLDSEDENTKYIAGAYALGIVNGISETQFAPNAPASKEQVAKLMLYVSGHMGILNLSGGNYKSYYEAALKCGIFSDIETQNDNTISPYAAAKTIFCVLNADSVELSSSDYKSEFSIDRSMSVMENNLYIYKSTGIVESNRFTSIYGGKSTDENHVEIDGNFYYTEKSGAQDLLGYKAEFYYKLENAYDEPEILYISPQKNANRIVFADALNIEECDGYMFKYYDVDSNKSKTEALTKQTVCIRNKVQTKMNNSVLEPEIGNVTIIDNDSDGKGDVVIVNDFEVKILEYVKTNPLELGDESSSGNLLKDIEPEDVFVYKNGNESALEDLKKDDLLLIINVKPDAEKTKYIYIYASDKKLSGTINTIDNGEKSIVVDGIRYDMNIAVDSKYLGSNGVFYIDYFGKISGYSIDADRVYGFLKHSNITDDDNVAVHIFTENNRWVDLNLKNRVKFNGTMTKKEALYNSVLSTYVGMITYVVNQEQMVYEINTPKEMERWSDEYKDAIEKDIFRQAYHVKNQYYREHISAIGTHIPYGFFTGNTKLFSVPSLQGDFDKDDVSIISPSAFCGEDIIAADIYIYDTDDAGNMGACLLVGFEPPFDERSDAVLVLGSGTAYIGGEQHPYIKAYNSGMEKKYYLRGNDIEIPQNGSVVLIQSDSRGYVTDFKVVYDSALGFEQKKLVQGPFAVKGLFEGIIKEVSLKDGRFFVDCNYSGGPIGVTTILNPNVYVYNYSTKKARIGALDDICRDKYCFVKASNLRALSIIVFEE
ncbi:MAG: S-layer homology domain-containing protein [Clostridia bacterium]|nr:S-layer homology domain-containing protein [Clostridia bacterium]